MCVRNVYLLFIFLIFYQNFFFNVLFLSFRYCVQVKIWFCFTLPFKNICNYVLVRKASMFYMLKCIFVIKHCDEICCVLILVIQCKLFKEINMFGILFVYNTFNYKFKNKIQIKLTKAGVGIENSEV